MSNKKEHDVTLDLIIQAADKLGEFSAGYDLEKFLQDRKTQSAVIMQLVVIGELTKRLPEEIKKQINLPWKEIAGFRDFAVHAYFELDLKKVWETVSSDIPVVKEKLQGF